MFFIQNGSVSSSLSLFVYSPLNICIHVPGEIANNGYAKVLGRNRGVLWDCPSSESQSVVYPSYPTSL